MVRLLYITAVCLTLASAFPTCHFTNKNGDEFDLRDSSKTDYEWRGTPINDITANQRWEFRLCGGLLSNVTPSADGGCNPKEASVCQFWGEDEGAPYSAPVFGSDWVYAEPTVEGSTLSMVSSPSEKAQAAVIHLFCGKTSNISLIQKDLDDNSWQINWSHPLACAQAVLFTDSSALVKITEKSNIYQMKLWNKEQATAAVVQNNKQNTLYWNFYNNNTFYAYTPASDQCQLSNSAFVDFVPILPTFNGPRAGGACSSNGKVGKSTTYNNGITLCANKTEILSYSSSQFQAQVTFFTHSVPQHGQFYLPFACTNIL